MSSYIFLALHLFIVCRARVMSINGVMHMSSFTPFFSLLFSFKTLQKKKKVTALIKIPSPPFVVEARVDHKHQVHDLRMKRIHYFLLPFFIFFLCIWKKGNIDQEHSWILLVPQVFSMCFHNMFPIAHHFVPYALPKYVPLEPI